MLPGKPEVPGAAKWLFSATPSLEVPDIRPGKTFSARADVCRCCWNSAPTCYPSAIPEHEKAWPGLPIPSLTIQFTNSFLGQNRGSRNQYNCRRSSFAVGVVLCSEVTCG